MMIKLFNTTKGSIIGKMDFLLTSSMPKKVLPNQVIHRQIYKLQQHPVTTKTKDLPKGSKNTKRYAKFGWLVCCLQRKTLR